VLVTPAAAQAPSLAFYGFRAGVPLRDTDGQVQLLLGRGLTCQQSRADRRLQDCRAVVTDPTTGKPLTVWLAAIDSAIGVLTVSGTLSSTELASWRIDLESTYGSRPTTVQGTQRMLQWVVGTQMLRLTWRVSGHEAEASVSIVDGPVLDGWTLGASGSARIAKPRPPG
jgi:hypothetical protein